MTHTLVARATSFGASALVMGGLVLLALSITYTVRDVDNWGPSPAPIEMTRPDEPPPPTPAPRQQAQPVDDPFDVTPLPPIQPTNADEPFTPFASEAVASGPMEITSPRWEQRPSDLRRFYPQRALTHGVEGEVLLDCLVRVSGLLDCRVVSESPAGWGFAAAAQRIARAHRMVPATRDGVAVDGRYVMRVPFQIE